MMSPVELEEQYQHIMEELGAFTPEGIIHVDLELLQSLGLLTNIGEEFGKPKHPLTHYFHVLETAEKITLFNDQFVIWIVPQMFDHEPVTFALVGVIGGDGEVKLEITFATSGVYNTSKIVLQVLEKLLEDIRENEEMLQRMQDDS